MQNMSSHKFGRWPIFVLALPMLGLLLLPLLALVSASSPHDITAGLDHELFTPALWLSAKTTSLSLGVIILFGTPLGWWLAKAESKKIKIVELLVDLPIVLPPAVVGIALLHTFGRRGVFGDVLATLGLQIPFSVIAVVIAQVVVAAPFYIQASAAAFRRVDPDLLLVAQTLGSTPVNVFRKVALPIALPGIISGAALSWARALGEFGATLLFAGNLAGETQTMPLAIYSALESDVRAAVAIALVLAAVALVLLLGLRLIPKGDAS